MRRRSSSPCLVCILLLAWLASAIAFANSGPNARVSSIISGDESSEAKLEYLGSETSSRREVLQKMIIACSSLAAPSQAAMTDETKTFATPAVEGTYYTQQTPSSAAITAPAQKTIMAPNLSGHYPHYPPYNSGAYPYLSLTASSMPDGVSAEMQTCSFRPSGVTSGVTSGVMATMNIYQNNPDLMRSMLLNRYPSLGLANSGALQQSPAPARPPVERDNSKSGSS